MSPNTAPDDPLTRAAVFASQAPSIHNSQPWRWRIDGAVLDLMLERGRVLRTTDPNARLAVLSCGALLHHARIDLAAHGWRAAVERFPERADADCLARLHLDGRIPVEPVAAHMAQAAARRRTDRRSPPSAPLDYDKLRSIGAAVQAEGHRLQLLRPRQVFDLAGAVDQARYIEAENPDRHAELASWMGADRPLGTGIPGAALPPASRYGAAPWAAFRRAGGMLVADSHHHAAVFAILHGPGDEPVDWLTAGEALSAGWLTATRLDVSVLPLSVVEEVASSRAIVRRMLSSGFPYLVLRLATASEVPEHARRTPRLPIQAIIQRDH